MSDERTDVQENMFIYFSLKISGTVVIISISQSQAARRRLVPVDTVPAAVSPCPKIKHTA